MGCGGQWKTVFAMVGVNLAFAVVNVLLKKVVEGGTDHMVIVTYRLLLSAIFLAPIAYFWERTSRPRLTFQILCYLFFGALFGLTLTLYLFLLGLQHTSASFSCAFLNTVPVITFILALLLGMEKVNKKTVAGRAKVSGAIICMGGAILLSLYKGIPLTKPHESDSVDIKNHDDSIMTDKNTQKHVVGSMFIMGSCFLWSSWFLLQAEISKRYPCQYSSTAILTFFGAIQSAIMTLISGRNIAMWVLKGYVDIVTIVYAGVVGSGLCYVVMSWCVKQRGPVFTAAFSPFTQIFASMFDFSILHDQIYLGSVIGSILVILGLYILLWGKSKEAKECMMKQIPFKEDGNGDVESLVPETTNSTSS